MTDQGGSSTNGQSDSESAFQFWGNMLYQNRTQNLTEFKSRMWAVVQWVVGLNIAATASLLTKDYQAYKCEIGFSVLLLAFIGSLFITFLHCGTVRQRRKLECVKKGLRKASEPFLILEPEPKSSAKEDRTCCFKDWTIGLCQIFLIVVTALPASAIALGDGLSIWCKVILSLMILVLIPAIASCAVVWKCGKREECPQP